MNMAVSALRSLYTRTLDRQDLTRKLHRVKHPRALPTVLSREEVTRMLNARTSIKHQAILSVAYGAGLRAPEVTKIKILEIDSERVLLRVECGKGGRHRNAMLAQDLLILLREWWKIGRQQGVMHPDGWLFPGMHYLKPICFRQVHRIAAEAAHTAGITKRVGSGRTRCATASRPICSRTASISTSSRSCLGKRSDNGIGERDMGIDYIGQTRPPRAIARSFQRHTLFGERLERIASSPAFSA
jgi:integrase/recombinase XerD